MNEKYMDYEKFKKYKSTRLIEGEAFYDKLINNIIEFPERYVGIYRSSNAKTKLIQNVTQSNEIKFGDFLEEIVTEYISILGYDNLDKQIGKTRNNRKLLVDQLFLDNRNDILYIVEQKIRDDHDSTKKEGQVNNFIQKLTLLEEKYPTTKIVGVMWFVDGTLYKNKNFYIKEIQKIKNEHTKVDVHLCYEDEFFTNVLKKERAWAEIKSYLVKVSFEHGDDVISIPDFNSSAEILNAMNRLTKGQKEKLLSNEPLYKKIRCEFFNDPNGNISKIK